MSRWDLMTISKFDFYVEYRLYWRFNNKLRVVLSLLSLFYPVDPCYPWLKLTNGNRKFGSHIEWCFWFKNLKWTDEEYLQTLSLSLFLSSSCFWGGASPLSCRQRMKFWFDVSFSCWTSCLPGMEYCISCCLSATFLETNSPWKDEGGEGRAGACSWMMLLNKSGRLTCSVFWKVLYPSAWGSSAYLFLPSMIAVASAAYHPKKIQRNHPKKIQRKSKGDRFRLWCRSRSNILTCFFLMDISMICFYLYVCDYSSFFPGHSCFCNNQTLPDLFSRIHSIHLRKKMMEQN